MDQLVNASLTGTSISVGVLPPLIGATIGGLLGLIVGSYLATILVRWSEGRSASHGRSRCDGCGRVLSPVELVPLVSYLALRGRCRTCGTRIAPLHPFVELGCGLLGAGLFALQVPALAPLAWLLLLLALFDVRHLWLPDRLVAVLAVIALVVPAWRAETGLGERALGGVIGFASLWLVARAYRRMTGRDGLGGGDAKLFGAIGLWLGARDLPLLMVVACAIGLADAAMRWPKGADRRDVQLPLGAYLCVAALGFALVPPLRTVIA